MSEAEFPTWPPGFWRRILLHPEAGAITGALEDDVHRFHLRLEHEGGVVTGAQTRSPRVPMTGCPGAGEFLIERIVGRPLAEIAAENARSHCTHLFDLAVLCAAHAGRTEPLRYDLKVADRIGDRGTATLERNGEQVMLWQIDGTMIVGPGGWPGRDLKTLSRWKLALPAHVAEQAEVLRRAILVSGARTFVDTSDLPAASRTHRLGACFNYSLPVAETSFRTSNWQRDWSESGEEPLGDYAPEEAFSAA